MVRSAAVSEQRVEKPWGHELIWAKTDRYVGKVLVIEAGKRLSLQKHLVKDESIYVVTGRMNLYLEDDTGEVRIETLGAGEHRRIPTGRIHRFEAIERTELMEVSTPELDDVVRLEDDFGRQAKGELYRKVAAADALMLVDAVHNWGPSATGHLFIERLYPLLWAGTRRGLPFASISCATNQGMHHLAHENYCKWAGGLGLRYIGGLAVHTTLYDEALSEAQTLGSTLADAALRHQREERSDWSDVELYTSPRPAVGISRPLSP